jgi:hypothetical protein
VKGLEERKTKSRMISFRVDEDYLARLDALAQRVKASFVDRQLSKPRLCERLGAFEPAPAHHPEAAKRAIQRYSPAGARPRPFRGGKGVVRCRETAWRRR